MSGTEDTGSIHYVAIDESGRVKSAGIAPAESWLTFQRVCGGTEVSIEVYNKLKSGRFLYLDGVISPRPVDTAELTQRVLTVRGRLLAASDWSQATDVPHAPDTLDLWRVYRQELRDLPAQAGFPLNVEWPTPPSNQRPQ